MINGIGRERAQLRGKIFVGTISFPMSFPVNKFVDRRVASLPKVGIYGRRIPQLCMVVQNRVSFLEKDPTSVNLLQTFYMFLNEAWVY